MSTMPESERDMRVAEVAVERFLSKPFEVGTHPEQGPEVPDEWHENGPLFRIVYAEDSGDPSVGIQPWHGFVLAEDQSGTQFERIVASVDDMPAGTPGGMDGLLQRSESWLAVCRVLGKEFREELNLQRGSACEAAVRVIGRLQANAEAGDKDSRDARAELDRVRVVRDDLLDKLEAAYRRLNGHEDASCNTDIFETLRAHGRLG